MEGVGVGIAAGLSVGAFRYLLAVSGAFRQGLCEAVSIAAAQGRWLWPILYMSAFFIIAWLLAKIVAREPMCTGSGIPQVKGVLMGKMSMNWASVLVAKIAGGVLAIGAGMSLGREGPSVQLGACAGQGIGRLSQSSDRGLEARTLLVAGAGAGLAAAFNAPLAGVIFGLEELQRTFSAAALLVSITAAVTATAVTGLFFGSSPVFSLGYLLPMPLDMLGWLAGLGLFVGTLGRMFNPSLL